MFCSKYHSIFFHYSSRQCEELAFVAPYQSHLHLFWMSKRKINDPASAHTFLSWTYSFQSLITLDLVRHNPSCNKNLEPANTLRSWQFCFTILQNAQNSHLHTISDHQTLCISSTCSSPQEILAAKRSRWHNPPSKLTYFYARKLIN
jgi:hypothetical protein